MVIYVDMLLTVNFIIAYFLFMSASLLSGYTYIRNRIIIASVAGAVFCLYIFVSNENMLLDISVKLISLTVGCVMAYGIKDKRRFFIQTVCYILLNMLLTGAIVLLSLKSSNVYEKNLFYYFNINPVILVFSSLVIYLLILLFEIFKEKISPPKVYLTNIYFKEFKLLGISAFYDSGFKVKDIIANKDVVIVSAEKIREQMPENLAENLENFFKGKYEDVGESFIPVFFNTLSGGGMVPSIKAEYMIVNERRIENIVVAFTQNQLSENVSAIFGTDIKKQL